MRADKFFAPRFGSRTKAAEALKAGLVLRDGRAVPPDAEVSGEDRFEFIADDRFVSNGGYKLAAGLDAFALPVGGRVFADLGASTGGFTEVLLRRGAKKVYCVDVGENQLAPEIAADGRVAVMDRTNARYLRPSDFAEPLDGVVSDLSFISLRLVLPAVCGLLGTGGDAAVLFKPQFECGRTKLGKSGICPPRLHRELLSDFYEFCAALGLAPVALVPAPIRARKNIEYVVHLKKGGKAAEKRAFLSSVPSFL